MITEEFKVRVHPKSSRNEIILKDGQYHAYVSVAPEDGKANKAVIGLISKMLKVPKTKITLLRGEKSREKVFEINRQTC